MWDSGWVKRERAQSEWTYQYPILKYLNSQQFLPQFSTLFLLSSLFRYLTIFIRPAQPLKPALFVEDQFSLPYLHTFGILDRAGFRGLVEEMEDEGRVE